MAISERAAIRRAIREQDNVLSQSEVDELTDAIADELIRVREIDLANKAGRATQKNFGRQLFADQPHRDDSPRDDRSAPRGQPMNEITLTKSHLSGEPAWKATRNGIESIAHTAADALEFLEKIERKHAELPKPLFAAGDLVECSPRAILRPAKSPGTVEERHWSQAAGCWRYKVGFVVGATITLAAMKLTELLGVY